MNDFKVKLSSGEFLNILNSYFEAGQEMALTVTGNSMYPFLVSKRDAVFLEKPQGKPKKGRIYMFLRGDGSCVLHRVKEVKEDGIYFIGDNQQQTEGPVKEENLIALCRKIKRKGKIITEKNPLWKFFQYIWINLVPLRFKLLKAGGKIKHLFQRFFKVENEKLN